LFFEFFFDRKRVVPDIMSQSRVYMVPLPDFTVYPERGRWWKNPFKFLISLFWLRSHILREENVSPFGRMTRRTRSINSAEIYDNPSMVAVVDLKWRAARSYFLG